MGSEETKSGIAESAEVASMIPHDVRILARRRIDDCLILQLHNLIGSHDLITEYNRINQDLSGPHISSLKSLWCVRQQCDQRVHSKKSAENRTAKFVCFDIHQRIQFERCRNYDSWMGYQQYYDIYSSDSFQNMVNVQFEIRRILTQAFDDQYASDS